MYKCWKQALIAFFYLFLFHNSLAQAIRVDANNKPLNQVLTELRDQYGLQLTFDDKALSTYKISLAETFNNPDLALSYLLNDLPFAPFFRALDALAIDDRSRRAGPPVGQLPTFDEQRIGGYDRACHHHPSGENSRSRYCAAANPGNCGPLAAGAQDIHQPIDDLPLHHRPLVAASLRARDQRADDRPLVVRQVARVAQAAAIVATTVLVRPHGGSCKSVRPHENHK